MSSTEIVFKVVMIAIFLLVAFPVHEFAHAWVAYLRGDATAKLFGRLTLNPIKHFDPIGGLMVIISVAIGGLLFGWAKPTPVNTANLKDRRNDEVLVALAGPASNLVMALAGALVYRALGFDSGPRSLVEISVYYFVLFNIALSIFNLLPIPPLDGSTLLFRFLSPKQVWEIRPILSQYGIFILLAFVLLGGTVLSTFVGNVTNVLVGR